MADTSMPDGAFSSEGRKGKSEPLASVEPAPAIEPPISTLRPPSLWQRLGIPIAAAAIVAAVVACIVSIGIHGLIGLIGRPGGLDGRIVQEGKVKVGLNDEREVFYPAPFAGPPNLELDGDNVNWNVIKLKEQKADRFVIQSTANAGFPAEIRWRADGMRGPPPPPPK